MAASVASWPGVVTSKHKKHNHRRWLQVSYKLTGQLTLSTVSCWCWVSTPPSASPSSAWSRRSRRSWCTSLGRTDMSACKRYEQTCRRCLPGQRVEQGGVAGEEVTRQLHHLQRGVVRQRHRQRAQVVVAHVWGSGGIIYPWTTLKSYLQSPGLGCSKTCWEADFWWSIWTDSGWSRQHPQSKCYQGFSLSDRQMWMFFCSLSMTFSHYLPLVQIVWRQKMLS